MGFLAGSVPQVTVIVVNNRVQIVCMFSTKSCKRPKTHFFDALEKLHDTNACLCSSSLEMKISTFLVPGLINSPHSIGVKIL